jgi:dTDP-4-dehydrorhamnose reductase
MIKKKILLLGRSGMVGSRIYELLNANYNIKAPLRGQLDLTVKKDIEFYIGTQQFDCVIYAAGVTNQDNAEINQDLALLLNAKVPRLICKKTATLKIPFLYLSTDAVFRGNSKNPYSETSDINPVNYYGKTKALGEEFVMQGSSLNSVIRLNSVYTISYAKKNDFVRKTLEKLKRGENVIGITDQYFNPTFVDSAVEALNIIARKSYSGIFHIGSLDCISNLNFIKLVCEVFKFDSKQISDVKFIEFFKNSHSKRGRFTCLDINNSRRVLGSDIFKTNESNLHEFHKLLTNKH